MVPGLVLTGTFSITRVRKRIIVHFNISGLQNVSGNLKTVVRTLATQVSLKIVQVSSIDKKKTFQITLIDVNPESSLFPESESSGSWSC